MGRWRNKGEAPAPEAPRRNAKKKANQEMQAFNTRLFDPVNATIEHADKLEMQSLANAARGGDPQAVQAYQDKLWNSGLTQEEKLALGDMFKVNQKGKRGNKNIKATLPNEGVESTGGRWRKYPRLRKYVTGSDGSIPFPSSANLNSPSIADQFNKGKGKSTLPPGWSFGPQGATIGNDYPMYIDENGKPQRSLPPGYGMRW